MPIEQQTAATQEFVTASLSTMELRLVREMTASEERTRNRIEQLKIDIAATPALFAGIKASVADLKDDVDDLQSSDKRWTAIATIVATVIASFFAWITGQSPR